MAFHEAKKSFSKDEIIDILKKNVALYRNEPEFVNYIVELAMYLLECKYNNKLIVQPELDGEELDINEEEKIPPEGEKKDFQLTNGSATKIYKVFRSYSQRSQDYHCHLCGAPTYGKRKCPNCGNMA